MDIFQQVPKGESLVPWIAGKQVEKFQERILAEPNAAHTLSFKSSLSQKFSFVLINSNFIHPQNKQKCDRTTSFMFLKHKKSQAYLFILTTALHLPSQESGSVSNFVDLLSSGSNLSCVHRLHPGGTELILLNIPPNIYLHINI